MIQGLYAAASGMMAVENQQSVIANNIANASTPGFKRQSSVHEGFYELLLNKMTNPAYLDTQRFPGGGLYLERTYSDFAEGPIAATGNPMNIALVGPGFLCVETPEGQRFTRDGRFTINDDGQLATLEGYPVLAQGEMPIRIEGSNVTFDDEGTVLVDGQPEAQLLITEFENPGMLLRDGENLFIASEAALITSRPAMATEVVAGSLEMSNVRMPVEMAQMMMGLRAYGAYQRVINSADETVGQLINQVAMPT
jgi:flagellar basal-body rod protein FlgF